MNFYAAINLVFRVGKQRKDGTIVREIRYYSELEGSPLTARLILTVLVNILFLIILFIAVSRTTWNYTKNENKLNFEQMINATTHKYLPVKQESIFKGEPMEKSVSEFKMLR